MYSAGGGAEDFEGGSQVFLKGTRGLSRFSTEGRGDANFFSS